MVLPLAAAALFAAAIGSTIQGAGSAYAGKQARKGQEKAAKTQAKAQREATKMQVKESKRQTLAGLLNDALTREYKASEGKRATQNDLSKSQAAVLQELAAGSRSSMFGGR